MTSLLVEERPAAAEPAPVPRAPSPNGTAPRVRYMPGLDGLRAIAVIGVIFYHCGVAFFSGGFLGVEVFFVISGYLITSLLVAERRKLGHVALRRFWVRRGKRLLPALFTVLVAVALYASLFLRDDLARLRGDLVAALTYVTNWWLIFGNRSYFETIGAPPLLKHLWSLAIEEQFYLIWPFLFAGLMFFTNANRRRVLTVLAVGATASIVWMWVLASPDHPDRAYMGTDTRAFPLLFGAMLALVWAPWRLTPRIRAQASRVLDLVGFAALGVVVLLFHVVEQNSAFLYPFGFVITSLASVLAIAVVVHPGSRVARPVVGCAPLRWIGLRSYGLYLWNWPIVAITDVQRGFTLFTGPALLAFRIGLTFVFAELSYRFVEQPIRTGSWRPALATLRGRFSYLGVTEARRARRVLATTGLVAAALVVFTIASVATATDVQSKLEAKVLNGRSEIAVRATTTTAVPVSVPLGATSTTAAVPAAPHITAIGDSVMLGAADSLLAQLGDVYVDAKKSRQFNEVFDIISTLRSENKLSPTIVIHLGTNGRIDRDQFVKMMQSLSDREKVVVLTVRVPRPWEENNNDIIRTETPKFPNAVLIDWQAEGDQHGDYFYADNIHLRQPDGANFYAGLIRQRTEPPPPPPPPTTAAPTTTSRTKR